MLTTFGRCVVIEFLHAGLIETLLKSAFESLDTENLVSAFLLARHASQEAPQIFPPYYVAQIWVFEQQQSSFT